MRSVESRMANMAVLCACIVALSHVGYATASGSAAWWFVRMTRCGLCCLAVPFFFTVSGYFLSRHFDERGWWLRETGKGVTSLLRPYLLWCIAFFAFWRIGAAAAGSEPFPVLCLAIPLLVSGLWLLTPAAGWPKAVTSMSFPIYAMHYFVVFALDGFRRPRSDKSICLMLAQAALAVAVPCAIAFAARRLAPRASSALFGGR